MSRQIFYLYLALILSYVSRCLLHTDYTEITSFTYIDNISTYIDMCLPTNYFLLRSLWCICQMHVYFNFLFEVYFLLVLCLPPVALVVSPSERYSVRFSEPFNCIDSRADRTFKIVLLFLFRPREREFEIEVLYYLFSSIFCLCKFLHDRAETSQLINEIDRSLWLIKSEIALSWFW